MTSLVFIELVALGKRRTCSVAWEAGRRSANGTSASWASPMLNENAREQYAILLFPSSSLTVCTVMIGAPVSSQVQGWNGRRIDPPQNVSASAAMPNFCGFCAMTPDGKSNAAERK